jgi:prepilin-type N-terminal cleavage/methylation domain-containing protein
MDLQAQPTRSRRRAYTLIELLIVIGLLGLAGAILVPQLVNQDSMTVQAAVRKLIGDLSFAQSDALANQELRRVHFYDDGRGYCIVRVNMANFATAFDGGTADYITDPLSVSDQYITDFVADDRFAGVTITSVQIDGTNRDVVYDPLGGTLSPGGLPGTGGTIQLNSGDDTFEVIVAPFTGKLTVREI